MSSNIKEVNIELEELRLKELKEKRTKLKKKEKLFTNLLIFLLFLTVISFFYFQIQKEKFDKNIYYGRYAIYYKSLDNGKERWFYSFILNGKRIDVPLYNNPKNFETLNISVVNSPVFNKNIVIVFYKKDNLSVITTATFNLARVLLALGYVNGKNLFISYLDNNTVNVVNSSFDVIAKGPLVCNSSLTTFIVLNASNKEDGNIIFNKSCIFLRGNNENLLKAVDLFDVLLTGKYNVKK
jgi:hypothetical protein